MRAEVRKSNRTSDPARETRRSRKEGKRRGGARTEYKENRRRGAGAVRSAGQRPEDGTGWLRMAPGWQ